MMMVMMMMDDDDDDFSSPRTTGVRVSFSMQVTKTPTYPVTVSISTFGCTV